MSCSVCGEQGHSMMKCPMLIAPLQPGFFTGGGGGGGGGEEDSTEKIDAVCDDHHLQQMQLEMQLLHVLPRPPVDY